MNEREWLADWISYLSMYPYSGPLEVIIVDNESSDGTVELAKENGYKVVTIKKDEFSYPRQLNLGLAAAKNEIVVVTVAHAQPANPDWLDIAGKHFADKKLAGIYGPCLPGKNAKLTEKIFYGSFVPRDHFQPVRAVKKVQMGVLGATNIAIRRSLWEKHPFDEAFAAGGEDTQWAKWAIENGHTIVFDRSFGVRHSHGLGFIDFLRQYRNWMKITKPHRYTRKDFQKHLRYED